MAFGSAPYAKLGVYSVLWRGGATAPAQDEAPPPRFWGNGRGIVGADRRLDRQRGDDSIGDFHSLSTQGADLYPQATAGTPKKGRLHLEQDANAKEEMEM